VYFFLLQSNFHWIVPGAPADVVEVEKRVDNEQHVHAGHSEVVDDSIRQTHHLHNLKGYSIIQLACDYFLLTSKGCSRPVMISCPATMIKKSEDGASKLSSVICRRMPTNTAIITSPYKVLIIIAAIN
jgi:hypothetical protein